MLSGDETAVPAVAAILEALPTDGPPVIAVLEVPEPDDRLYLAAPERVNLRWSVRAGQPHGAAQLSSTVSALDAFLGPVSAAGGAPRLDDGSDKDLLWEVPGETLPSGDVYVWAAGEAGSLRALRHHLTQERGLPHGASAVMGYWRRGRAAP